VHRYRAELVVEVLNEDDTLNGAPLLPDFTMRVGDLFVE